MPDFDESPPMDLDGDDAIANLTHIALHTPSGEYTAFTDQDEISRAAETASEADAVAANTRGFVHGVSNLFADFSIEVRKLESNFEKRIAAAHKRRESIVRELRMLASEVATNAAANGISRPLTEARLGVTKLIAETDAHCMPLKTRLEAALTELNTLRRDYHIKYRQPLQVDDARVSIAWIAAAMLLEIAVNGFFFLNATEAGVVGGIFEVFFFAPYNVVSASLTGYYSLRYIHHNNHLQKILAGLTGIFLVAFVFLLNIYLTALRISFDPTNIYTVVELISLILGPRALEFMNYEALGIMVLGFSLAAYACWKAYRIKDPHPGYSEAWNQVRSIGEALDDAKRIYTENLDKILAASHAKLEAILAEQFDKAGDHEKLHHLMMPEFRRYRHWCETMDVVYREKLHHFETRYMLDERVNDTDIAALIEHESLPFQPFDGTMTVDDAEDREVVSIISALRNHGEEVHHQLIDYIGGEITKADKLFRKFRT